MKPHKEWIILDMSDSLYNLCQSFEIMPWDLMDWWEENEFNKE